MADPTFPEADLLEVMAGLHAKGLRELRTSQVAGAAGIAPWVARRLLAKLADDGKIQSRGKTKARVYWLPLTPLHSETNAVPDTRKETPSNTLSWSPASVALASYLAKPISQRDPVTYQREFVEGYVPNVSYLLGERTANSLYEEGAVRGQLPAGTYLRKVLNQLLVDLAWSSSNLEGNTISYLDTERLFALTSNISDAPAFPAGADAEHRILLINHKRAITFLADQVPDTGLSTYTVRNLHALLMEGLVTDVGQLGAIRRQIVSIGRSTYTPLSIPQVLEDMLALIIDKAGRIKNPVEAGFFLWVNIAYLQPFVDGNKRTSRLSANIPLMLYNCSPLSFMDVDVQDYNRAMQGVYERRDVSIAVDLFTWLYRRSITRYGTVTEAMGTYDPDTLVLRPYATAVLLAMVREGLPQEPAILHAAAPEQLAVKLREIVKKEIDGLSAFNCQRHGITPAEVEAWRRKQAGERQ